MSQWSFERVLFWWSLCGLGLFAVTALMYLQWQGFGEQGQVNFAAVSHLIYQGYPLYTDADYPARYSLQHGPLIFLITGAIMKLFGAHFVTAKLSGVLATVGALVFSWKWFRKFIGMPAAFLLLGLEVWMLFHWNYIYFIRPDSMLLLCTTVSLYTVTTQSRLLYLVFGIAIPLAMAVNLKIHGFLYFIPIFLIAHRSVPHRVLYGALGIGMIAAFLPYLLPGISIKNYWLVLTYSLEQGFHFSNFIPKVAAFTAIFLMPVSFACWKGLRLKPLIVKHKHELSCFFFLLMFVSLIASKDGSGTNHLMPFIPMFFYFYMKVILEYRRENKLLCNKNASKILSNPYGILLLILLLIVTIGGGSTQKRLWEHMRLNDYSAVVQDVQQVQRAYPDLKIEVGYGDISSYNRLHDMIVVPVFAGNPLYLEYVAMADMQQAGVKIPQATLQSLSNGDIAIWLIPKGDAPFTMGGKVFDEDFKKVFFKNYGCIKSTAFFDIWMHNNIKDI